jgi:general secretion pathway protein I
LYRATSPPIDGNCAGFTIIEVLIALAVVAVSIVSIGSVVSTNLRGVQALEHHVALIQAARSTMAMAIPPRAEIADGVSSGDLNGYRWKIDIGPLGEEWTVRDSDVAWSPQLVKIQVQSPTGAAFNLNTVRLMRRPRQ